MFSLNGGRLVSLWDMLTLNSENFLKLLRDMDALRGVLMGIRAAHTNQELTLTIDKTMRKGADDIIDLLDSLELTMSLVEAKRLKKYFEADAAKSDEAENRLSILSDRIHDEICLRTLIVLTQQEAELFSQPLPLFGQEVDGAFPSATYDIAEVGKCLALSRSTAGVMHCMRALEKPLQLMANDLNVKNTRDNWGNLLNDIDEAIIELPNSEARKSVYAEAAIQFRHIKVAWRDHAMHARGKYTEDEARPVMNATKELMGSLAKSIKE